MYLESKMAPFTINNTVRKLVMQCYLHAEVACAFYCKHDNIEQVRAGKPLIHSKVTLSC